MTDDLVFLRELKELWAVRRPVRCRFCGDVISPGGGGDVVWGDCADCCEIFELELESMRVEGPLKF
jgi:hypothetical protein